MTASSTSRTPQAAMSRSRNRKSEDSSLIVLDKFIQATRDSGYKGTSSAISELVDNSIQADASEIAITIVMDNDQQIQVSVLDNGCGMDPFTLRQALRFGGSTRFGDRTGLGRYGMGLPNASLSQARRVTVYTWQSTPDQRGTSNHRRVYVSALDVDEIIRGEVEDVPRPRLVASPPLECNGASGTLVIWSRCDRLENRRVSTIQRKLEAELGRRFRHFLWKGLRLSINSKPVEAFDPLYLHSRREVTAKVFGDGLRYEVCADPSDPKTTGQVYVRFSELPVHEWWSLSNEEKRDLGISKGAGVSIVRAGREVDYGWFFMGAKHRENYDDWWRCEIYFEPVLDEAFGITHTKQQVRPQAYLLDALTPDLEAIARALNSRVRKAHLAVKSSQRFSEAERVAEEQEHLLPPLPTKANSQTKDLMKELERRHPTLWGEGSPKEGRCRYRIIESTLKDTCFFSHAFDGKRLVLILNPDHPFYREIYKPLADSDLARDQQLRVKLELLMLAAARGELASPGVRQSHNGYRKQWSDTLATFLNG
jgi:hypothetical protein